MHCVSLESVHERRIFQGILRLQGVAGALLLTVTTFRVSQEKFSDGTGTDILPAMRRGGLRTLFAFPIIVSPFLLGYYEAQTFTEQL